MNIITSCDNATNFRMIKTEFLTKWSSCWGDEWEYKELWGPTGPSWSAIWLSAWFLSTFMASSSRSSIRVPCTNRIPKHRHDYTPVMSKKLKLYLRRERGSFQRVRAGWPFKTQKKIPVHLPIFKDLSRSSEL